LEKEDIKFVRADRCTVCVVTKGNLIYTWGRFSTFNEDKRNVLREKSSMNLFGTRNWTGLGSPWKKTASETRSYKSSQYISGFDEMNQIGRTLSTANPHTKYCLQFEPKLIDLGIERNGPIDIVNAAVNDTFIIAIYNHFDITKRFSKKL
jgi:hypothetical protein